MKNPLKTGIRTVLFGVLINGLLAVIKIAAGILGNTYALIADGIESTTDIFSSLIVWGGLKIASRPADSSHPYGHGKAESIASMVVSLALLGAAILIAYDSIIEISNPHSVPKPWTLAVLAGVVIIKETLFRRISNLGNQSNSTAMKTDAFHHRSDAITSAAAFVGISIALIDNRLSSADDWAALAASFIIAFNGINMLRRAMQEIMDAASPKNIEDGVREIATGIEGVVDTEKCFIRKSGFNFIVDIHVVVDGNISVYEGHEIAHKIKDKLIESSLAISSVMVHIEPNNLKDYLNITKESK